MSLLHPHLCDVCHRYFYISYIFSCSKVVMQVNASKTTTAVSVLEALTELCLFLACSLQSPRNNHSGFPSCPGSQFHNNKICTVLFFLMRLSNKTHLRNLALRASAFEKTDELQWVLDPSLRSPQILRLLSVMAVVKYLLAELAMGCLVGMKHKQDQD